MIDRHKCLDGLVDVLAKDPAESLDNTTLDELVDYIEDNYEEKSK